MLMSTPTPNIHQTQAPCKAHVRSFSGSPTDPAICQQAPRLDLLPNAFHPPRQHPPHPKNASGPVRFCEFVKKVACIGDSVSWEQYTKQMLTRDEAIKILRSGPHGVHEWNKHRQNKVEIPELNDISLAGIDLSSFHLSGLKLMRCDLTKAILTGAKLDSADLTKANLTGAALTDADLSGANLTGATLNQADLVRVDLSKARCAGASLQQADLSYARVIHADMNGCVLVSAILTHTVFTSARLVAAIFRRSNLHDAFFKGANLTGADLRGVHVNNGTRLTDAEVLGCRIDRYTLELLDNYGGLTKGDRMRMSIVDGVADLRQQFGGLMRLFHGLALAAFAFPYAWFLVKQWMVARFSEADETITLFRVSCEYIWTGGDWTGGDFTYETLAFLPVAYFGWALFYNVIRFGMLVKTNNLESKERTTGLPERFHLAGWWKYPYWVVKWGFWVNLLIVAAHTWHFLGQRIPIPEM